MIKNNQQMLNRLHLVLDVLVLALAYALAWGILVIRTSLLTPERGLLPAQYYFLALVVIIPLYLILYTCFHLYEPKRIQSRRFEFANICKANLFGLMILAVIYFLFRKNPYLQEFSTRMVFYFFAINIVAETAERTAIRVVLCAMRAKG